MFSLFRILVNLVRLKDASDRRAESREDLKNELLTQKAKADPCGGQFWLERDMKRFEKNEKKLK